MNRWALVAAVAWSAVLAGAVEVQAGKVAVVVQVESVNRLVDQANLLATAFRGQPPGPKALSALESALGNVGLVGVDSNREFSVYVLLPDAPTQQTAEPFTAAGPSVVFVMPLAGDGKAFLETVGRGFEQSEKGTAFTTFRGRRGPAGGSPSLCVAVQGNRAVVGNASRDVQTVLAKLAEGGARTGAAAAVTGTVRAEVDAAALLQPLEAMAQGVKATMAQAMAQQPPGMAPGAPSPAVATAVVASEMDALIQLARQIRTLTAGLSVTGGALELRASVDAVPGTALATMLKNAHVPSDKYAAAFPTGTLLAAYGCGLNVMDSLIDPFCDMMEKMYAAMGPAMDPARAWVRKVKQDVKGLYAGEYAVGIVPGADGKGLGVVEIVAVTDPARAMRIHDESLAVWAQMGKSNGVSIVTQEPRTYKGVSVRAYSYTATNAVAGAANPLLGPTGVPSWMKGMKWEVACVGNDLLYTVGPPIVMDAAIERLSRGGERVERSEAFARLFPDLPYKPVKAYSVSFLRLAKAALALLPGVNPQMLAGVPDGSGGLAGFSVKMENTTVHVVRVGLQDAAAVPQAMTVVGTVMMQSAMAGMAGGGQETDANVRARCAYNLRTIDAAKEQYAMEKRLAKGAAAPGAFLLKYVREGRMPACPAGGTYTTGTIGTPPKCSIPGHTMD